MCILRESRNCFILLCLCFLSSCDSFTLTFVSSTTISESSQVEFDVDQHDALVDSTTKIQVDDRQSVINFVYMANQAEIDAAAELDIDLVSDFFIGRRLTLMERLIDSYRTSKNDGVAKYLEFDKDRSYYADMWSSSESITVEACEYWQETSYGDDGQVFAVQEWLLVPLLLKIDTTNGEFRIYDEIAYEAPAFCQPVPKPVSDSAPTAFPLPSFSLPTKATGQVNWEKWNIPWPLGVETLIDSSSYPSSPNVSDYLMSMEAPRNSGDTFGQRISGYLYPPVTGSYVFWVSGDDSSELWLSTSADPDQRLLIAESPEFTEYRAWDTYPSQQSGEIVLKEGSVYYVEAIAVDGNEHDHLSVAWQIPGESRVVIDGKYLEPVWR